MPAIRPFVRSDIPEVVALRARAFHQREQASDAAMAARLEHVFLRNPWYDPDLPSWVSEDTTGRVVGFLGVVPRKMVHRGQELRVVVGSQFMVDPEHRGLAGIHLLTRLFNGSQDLILSDAGNDVARGIWERMGGQTALLYSLTWIRPLQPLRYASTRLGRDGPAGRVVSHGLRPFAAIVDALASRLPGSPYRLVDPAGEEERLDPESVAELLPTFLSPAVLAPVYEPATVGWLLERASERSHLGELTGVLVRGEARSPIGWYLYFQNQRGVGEVVQIAAQDERYTEVLDHLFHHARRAGLTALTGRVEPAMLPALANRACTFHREGPWCLVHSRHEHVLCALHQGNSFVSRLEGEWWMGF